MAPFSKNKVRSTSSREEASWSNKCRRSSLGGLLFVVKKKVVTSSVRQELENKTKAIMCSKNGDLEASASRGLSKPGIRN